MFNAKQKKFPSSIGELHFSMEPQGLLAQLVEQFPSPIGELHFSIMCCDYSINYQTRFRPLSGNYISQLNRATLTGFVTEFPSPVGELHFSIEKDYDDPEAYECKVSVPCRGTTFLNGGKKFTKSEYTVSVPCRGTTFLNMEMKSPVFLCRSFRPLSGNYNSQ